MKLKVKELFFMATVFFKLILLFAADTSHNGAETNEETVNFLECPKEDIPIEMLRENSMKQLTKKGIKIIIEMHSEFTQFLSVEWPGYYKNEHKILNTYKQLNKKVAIWHFSMFIEGTMEGMKAIEINENDDTFSEMRKKILKEWENFDEKIEKGNIVKEICVLQGFAHRIVRNDTLNSNKHWAEYSKAVTEEILSIEVGPMFNNYAAFTTLTETEFAEHSKKCDELEYANNCMNKLLHNDCNHFLYRKCLEHLIWGWTEFRHYLCYNKKVKNYKDWLFYLMGKDQFYLLEERQPNIMHIEEMCERQCVGAHYHQFLDQTGSTSAIAQESRIAVRHILANATLRKLEKLVRQNAEKGIGEQMLSKMNQVKSAALAYDTVMTPKAICMLFKLNAFLCYHHGMPGDALLLQQKVSEPIDQWWPNECDRKEESEQLFKFQHNVLHKQKRQMYPMFMNVWHVLSTVRGGPTRLHKFLQMAEYEIELEWIKDDQKTDPDVFQSPKLLENHYIDALSFENPSQCKAMKLAADISVWVIWLENEVLEMAEYKTKFKLPRLTMAWKQNRWYYEMMYDQLFDIEKEDEEAEVEKKGQQIGTLLQLSNHLVGKKLGMPDQKLKVEGKKQKMQRLEEGTAQPPNGTMDREWHEIRRRSEMKVFQMRAGKGEEAVDKWLQKRHFEHIKEYLSKSDTFNSHFIKKLMDENNLLRLAQLVGNENVEEIDKIAHNFFGKINQNDGECSENAHTQIYSDKKQQMDKKSENDSKKGTNYEQKAFDVDTVMKLFNLEEDTKKGKMPKKSGSTKNKPKNKGQKSGIVRKSPINIEVEISPKGNGKTTSDELASAEAKIHLEKGTESFLTPREQFSDQEVEFKTPLNSPRLELKLEEKHYEMGIVPKEEEKETVNSKSESQKSEEKQISNEKIKSKSENEKNREKAQLEKKRTTTNNSTKSEETTKEEKGNDQTDEVEEDDQKKGMQLNDLFGANEKGWQLFLEDQFLVKSFQRFFMNPTKLLQGAVEIGCLINEIGHRMELISKLCPIEGQQMLIELLKRGIVPSKWMHQKLEQNWQQIGNDQLTNAGLISRSDPSVGQSPAKNNQIYQISQLKEQNSDKIELKTLQNNLWEHLKMVVKCFDINSVEINLKKEDEKDWMNFVERQIILRKMALAILSERENLRKIRENVQFGTVDLLNLSSFWHKLNNERQEKITTALFGNKIWLKKLNEFCDHFLVMTEQIEQDQKLYYEMQNFSKTQLNSMGNFEMPLHLQEIQIFNRHKEQIESDKTTKNMLTEFLSKNSYGIIDNNRKFKIDQAITIIERIVKRWKHTAKFIVTGSYQLGVLTQHSDIDAICVVPTNLMGPQIFGSENCEIHRDSRVCPDKSLYCRLCLLTNVVSIRSIQNAWISLVELTFQMNPNTTVDFDIGFATFESNENIFKAQGPIKYEQSDALSAKMALQIEKLVLQKRESIAKGEGYDKMMEINGKEEKLKMKLRSLAGFEVGTIILNKLMVKENGKEIILDNYRTFLLAIKCWAKEHHIYDNKLGFFNGISLSILVAKVMLLYPMASLPFLIEKFFFTFSTWPWPTPLKLTDLPNWSVLRWNPSDEVAKHGEIYSMWGLMPQLEMPIVTPGHIEQNATFNVNKSTASIIQREMQKAIETIQNWPNLTVSQEKKWENLLMDKKIEEKYSHFIRIICTAFSLADFYDFCGFVETRIRLQLVFVVERFEHIQLAHAKKVVEKEQQQSEENEKEIIKVKGRENERGGETFEIPKISKSYRRIWLVGIEVDQLKAGTELEWIQRLNSMLSTQFDAVIDNTYRRMKNFSTKKWQQIKLNSKYE